MVLLIRIFNLFGKTPAVVLCFKSLVGTERVDRDIIKLLQDDETPINQPQQVTKYIIENILYFSDTKEVTDFSSLIKAISSGKAVVLIDGAEQGIEMDVVKQEKGQLKSRIRRELFEGQGMVLLSKLLLILLYYVIAFQFLSFVLNKQK